MAWSSQLVSWEAGLARSIDHGLTPDIPDLERVVQRLRELVIVERTDTVIVLLRL